MKQLFTALVGSQAHGLAEPDSDFDYRGVFMVPTSQLLTLNTPRQRTHWGRGAEDDVSWELGWFLELATKCNPTILEAFRSPQITYGEPTERARWILDIFPSIWNSDGVYNAFRGYGASQRKKFLDDKDGRRAKYAVAYLRTLYNAWELLKTGDFQTNISQSSIFDTCKQWRRGEFEIGEVIQTCAEWEKRVEAAYQRNPNKQTNFDLVNDTLLMLREGYFREEDWV